MGRRLTPFRTFTGEVRKGEELTPLPLPTTTPLGVWGGVRIAGTQENEVRKNLPGAGSLFPTSAVKIQTGRPSL
jgi:hypothetical protein